MTIIFLLIENLRIKPTEPSHPFVCKYFNIFAWLEFILVLVSWQKTFVFTHKIKFQRRFEHYKEDLCNSLTNKLGVKLCEIERLEWFKRGTWEVHIVTERIPRTEGRSQWLDGVNYWMMEFIKVLRVKREPPPSNKSVWYFIAWTHLSWH